MVLNIMGHLLIYNAFSQHSSNIYILMTDVQGLIEWILERYAVTRDDASGIVNDPNEWADEHGNPRYILDLLLSVITVSMKTMEIVESLPRFEC